MFETQRFWNLEREFARLQDEVTRLFNIPGPSTRARTLSSGAPPMALWAHEDSALVTMVIPGIDPKKLSITVLEDTLTVQGSYPELERQEGKVYHRKERPSGTFGRVIQLPFSVEDAKVEAHFENGILRITLPRSAATQAKHIPIHTA